MFKESHFHTQVIQQSQTITTYQTMRNLETQKKDTFFTQEKRPFVEQEKPNSFSYVRDN